MKSKLKMNLTNSQKKLLTIKNLNKVSRIENRPVDKKGNLDIDALNKMPVVKGVVDELKNNGIDKEWLMKNGFFIACMVLRFGKQK